jgi:adenosylcobyric acid synthase
MPAIMVVGTTSHAGKSLMTAAICRLLVRQGHRVTPFKGQNMALNAYVTAEGGEIGHAQAVQAWAAKIEPQVAMNPILLKPQGDMTSQVILLGQSAGRVGAAEYYEKFFDRGWQAITSSLDQLQKDYDYIVCEGAGSPAEINLKHRDLTNMRVASYLQAKTLLVADIDRGGVFAHIVGTLELLEPAERALIKGFVINKFRGQRSLLESGLDWLTERTGIPVLGVMPYFQSQLPAEDSLDLFDRRINKPDAELQIAVIRLPRMANFTDFDPLMAEASVQVSYLDKPSQQKFDAIILPGSKTTIADCLWLQATGLADWIKAQAAVGTTILGICGGLQMLGDKIFDPDQLEGEIPEVTGLGLLPVETVMLDRKILRQRQVASKYFSFAKGATCDSFARMHSSTCLAGRGAIDSPVTGYEIHQGQSNWMANNMPQTLFDDPDLGWVWQDQIWATYLHGLFDNGAWRRSWLNRLRVAKNLPLLPIKTPDYASQRNEALDTVANLVGEHLDLKYLL